MWSLGSSSCQEEGRNALVAASSSALRRTATVNGVVTWKMGKEGVGGGGRGGGHRESQGTGVDYQQVKLKVEACLDRAAPGSFSVFSDNPLLLLLPSAGGECLPERGFKSCPS